MLKKSISNKDGELARNISELDNAITILDELSSVAYTNMLIDNYLTDSDKSIQEQIKKIEELELNGMENYDIMLNADKNYVSEFGKLYQKFSSGGCIKDGVLDVDCINLAVEKDNTVSDLQESTNSARIVVRKYVDKLFNVIILKINTIGKEING
jgi:hypothetical protein